MPKNFRSNVVEIASGSSDDPVVIAGTDDPSSGGGISAPQGSLFLRFGAGEGQLWLKFSDSDTGWKMISSEEIIEDHIENKNNPHEVTASQVGKDIAQWNADRIQNLGVSEDDPESGQALVWDGDKWRPGEVAGGTPSIGEISSDVTNSTVSISQKEEFSLVDVSTKSNILRGFSMPSNGILRFDEEDPGTEFLVLARLVIYADGTDFEARVRIALNNQTIEETEAIEPVFGFVSNKIHVNIFTFKNLSLSKDDELSVHIANWTGSEDIKINRMLISARNI